MKRFIVGLLIIALVLGLSSGVVSAKTKVKTKTIRVSGSETYSLKVNKAADWVITPTKLYDANPKIGKYKWKKRKEPRIICTISPNFVKKKGQWVAKTWVTKKRLNISINGTNILLNPNGVPRKKALKLDWKTFKSDMIGTADIEYLIREMDYVLASKKKYEELDQYDLPEDYPDDGYREYRHSNKALYHYVDYINGKVPKSERVAGGVFYVSAYKYGKPHTKQNLLKKWRIIIDANKRYKFWIP
jgi:hypothetical protein